MTQEDSLKATQRAFYNADSVAFLKVVTRFQPKAIRQCAPDSLNLAVSDWRWDPSCTDNFPNTRRDKDWQPILYIKPAENVSWKERNR